MADSEESQRADALRNRRLVIEAGLELLTEDPNLGMQEIADASGLGRTTVYRHFPNREELIGAVFAEAVAQARAATGAAIAGAEDATGTIQALGETAVEINVGFRRLISAREIGAAVEDAATSDRSPLGNYMREARVRGEIRTDMPIHWQLTIMQVLSNEALEEVDAGALELEDAKRLVGETLVSILRS